MSYDSVRGFINVSNSTSRVTDLDELRSKGSLEELICQVEPMVSSSIKRSTAFGMVVAVTLVVVILAILIPYLMRSE